MFLALISPRQNSPVHGLSTPITRARSRASLKVASLIAIFGFQFQRITRIEYGSSFVSNPDVITGEAPHRYASALLDLAEEGKSLKTVEKDLKTVKNLFANNAELRRMTASPVYAVEDKVASMTALAKKAKLGKLVTQFIGTVAENRRTDEIPAMISVFEDLLARRRGTQVAQVTSAKKLTATQMTKLKAELKKVLGRTVDIDADVDPDLLGGFVVRIGSRLYDSSLKTQIEDLKLALKEA